VPVSARPWAERERNVDACHSFVSIPLIFACVSVSVHARTLTGHQASRRRDGMSMRPMASKVRPG
jgi:hypothetical protein